MSFTLRNLTFEDNQIIFMTDSVQEILEIDPSLYKGCLENHSCPGCIEGRTGVMCFEISNFFPIASVLYSFNILILVNKILIT